MIRARRGLGLAGFLVSVAAVSAVQGTAGAATATVATDASRCRLAHRMPTTTPGDPNLPVGVSLTPDQGDAAGRDVTCIETSLKLAAAGGALPKIGQSGTLTLTVVTDPAEGTGSVGVSVALPGGITARTPPAGFNVAAIGDPLDSATASARVKGDGAHPTAIWGYTNLTGGTTKQISFPVTVSKAGAGTIESIVGDVNGLLKSGTIGGVTGPPPPVTNPGAMATLPLTYSAAGTTDTFSFPGVLGLKAASSALISAYSPAWPKSPSVAGKCPGGDVARTAAGFCETPTGLIPPADRPAAGPALRARGVRAHAAATTCVHGTLVYSTPLGGVKPVGGLPFKVIDVNPVSDNTIGGGATDSGGNFDACFNNDETSWTQSGSADVILRFKTDTTQFGVVDRSPADFGWTPKPYVFETGRWDDIPSGNLNWGMLQPQDNNYNRLLHAFDLAYSAWSFSNSRSPGAQTCWNNTDCEAKKIMWGPTAREWPARTQKCASRLSSAWFLCLPDNGPDWEVVALHELGHSVMFDYYPSGRPAHNCPVPHYGWTNEESGCAWTEGFASWFADAVLGANYSAGYGGEVSPSNLSPMPWSAPKDVESAGWGSYIGISRGSNSEDRITNALWDLADSNNEGYWDRSSLGIQAIWDGFLQQPDNFGFMVNNALASAGVDNKSSDFLSTLYANTIDMASSPFREPLNDDSDITRPLPPSSPPALNIVNTANPSSAVPQDTTNGHSYVWNRGLLQCTDSVEIDSVGNWSKGYLGAGVKPDPTDPSKSYFDYNWVNLTAFSDAAMTSSFATVTTGTQNLWQRGWRVLKLPMKNEITYLYVLGSAVNGPKDGSVFATPSDVYRLRPHKCTTWILGNGPLTLGSVTEQFAGVRLTAGRTYRFTLAPAAGALNPSRKRLTLAMSLAAGSPGCDTLDAPAAGAGDCNWDRSVATVSGSTRPGAPVSLSFTPTSSGRYQLDFLATNGPGNLVATAVSG